ncbi:eukaryotic translation initiation factor 3 subunit A-like [Miscanthus floridulus]|uniref:eukaryotic translation initiation factor 3 subunit A-like n=1 Tax=Miscanthus floridulus TaxID=154761 RepID=UPI003458AE3A
MDPDCVSPEELPDDEAAQKETVDARKKKRTKEIQRKQEKEQEIAPRVKARERRSDDESKLESEDPTDVDDMIFSEEEESREVVVTSAESRDPAAISAGDEQEVERRAMVPMPRKHTASADTVGEWEAKQTQSPRPSVASPVLSPPAANAAQQTGQSKERTGIHASPGSALACDSQPEDAPPAASVGLS